MILAPKKERIAVFCALILSSCLFAQVGIGTTEPQATLDIRAQNHLGAVSAKDGILIPKVNSLSASGRTDGQMVYLIANTTSFSKGFHFWDEDLGEWRPIDSTVEPWYEAGTTSPATSNSSNIYTMGQVGIGTNDPLGALHITTTNSRDVLFFRFLDKKTDDLDLDIYRSRGNINNPAPVTEGTLLGGVRFNGNTSNAYDFEKSAEISAVADGDYTSASSPGKITFSTTPENTVSNLVERMTIKNDGKIGVNTTSPESTLHVNGSVSKPYCSTSGNATFYADETHYTITVANITTSLVLPDPATCEGRIYVLIGRNGMGGTVTNITVQGGGGESVYDNSTNTDITTITKGDRYVIQSTGGSQYIVIGR